MFNKDDVIEGAQLLIFFFFFVLKKNITSKRSFMKKQTFSLVTMATDISQLDNEYFFVVEHQRAACFYSQVLIEVVTLSRLIHSNISLYP